MKCCFLISYLQDTRRDGHERGLLHVRLFPLLRLGSRRIIRSDIRERRGELDS